MLADIAPRLACAAGPLLPYLDDPTITELRVNSNGGIFIVSPGAGKAPLPLSGNGAPLAEHMDHFLALIADMVGAEWRASSPCLHAGIPALGLRVQAGRPPVSPGIWMVVRKHPATVIPLSDFERQGIITDMQHAILVRALRNRQTILIAGAVGSAKTSIVNALLGCLHASTDRIVILEDDPELQCAALDVEFLRTAEEPRVTMADLCKTVLRMTPDRLVIGEVRDGAALDMLKAFHRGTAGLGTIHAASALGALTMLEQLVGEVSAAPQQRLIGDAVDLIGYMTRQGGTWRMTELLAVEGWDGTQYRTSGAEREILG